MYVLRLQSNAAHAITFWLGAKIAPLAMGRNIAFLRNAFLDCNCVVTNLEFFSAIDRSLVLKQKTLTFGGSAESCAFLLDSFDTVITAQVFLV